MRSKRSLKHFVNRAIERPPEHMNSSYCDDHKHASLTNTTPLGEEVITRLKNYGRMLCISKQSTDNQILKSTICEAGQRPASVVVSKCEAIVDRCDRGIVTSYAVLHSFLDFQPTE